jgi:hypothetical protein
MLKVADYRLRAAECRKLAAETRDPNHREQLEEMGRAWERLAEERTQRIVQGTILPDE